MNATIDLLRGRRSVPPQLMAPDAPDAAALETILRAASRVPDHGKLAPWRFVVVVGEARVRLGEAIAAAFAADNPDAGSDRLAVERGRLTRAPVAIAVVSRVAPHPKIPNWEQVLSVGASCMNLIVAANALGFATAWLTEWYAYDRRIMTALGCEPHETLAGFIHLGVARTVPEDRTRPSLDDVVTYL